MDNDEFTRQSEDTLLTYVAGGGKLSSPDNVTPRYRGELMRLMEAFGSNPAQYVSAHPWAARLDRSADLGSRRVDGDMRLNVFHYPIYGWVDAVVMNLLMGQATVVQLDE